MSDEFDKYLNSKIGKKNKNLDILNNFFEKNQLKILQERSVSIVGTNGKTSCSFFLNELLRKNNVATCMFTSPHLVKVNERIKVNNNDISDKELSFYLDQLIKFGETAANSEWVIVSFLSCLSACKAANSSKLRSG